MTRTELANSLIAMRDNQVYFSVSRGKNVDRETRIRITPEFLKMARNGIQKMLRIREMLLMSPKSINGFVRVYIVPAIYLGSTCIFIDARARARA